MSRINLVEETVRTLYKNKKTLNTVKQCAHCGKGIIESSVSVLDETNIVAWEDKIYRLCDKCFSQFQDIDYAFEKEAEALDRKRRNTMVEFLQCN